MAPEILNHALGLYRMKAPELGRRGGLIWFLYKPSLKQAAVVVEGLQRGG